MPFWREIQRPIGESEQAKMEQAVRGGGGALDLRRGYEASLDRPGRLPLWQGLLSVALSRSRSLSVARALSLSLLSLPPLSLLDSLGGV